MKQLNYLFALALCFHLFSCEKEEFAAGIQPEEGGDEFYISPEDTAGIRVPEGEALVVFPGHRAATKAAETRISHLQYLIYQEDATTPGKYLQYKGNRIVDRGLLSSWPLKSIVTTLPKDKNYKVVFLGNVDPSVFGAGQTREVLTGTGDGTDYAAARILLPRVEFSENTMYYTAVRSFSTNAAAYVPVTLKRIVSRNDITKEGLSPGYADGVTDDATYKSAYWKEMVQTKLKESIFTGLTSAFRYQVAEEIKRNLIYPFIYIGLAKPEDVDALTGYSAVAKYKEEWAAYNPGKTYTDIFDQYRSGEYKGYVVSGDQYPNNVFIRYAQYLYDAFVVESSQDTTTLKGALSQIYADNKPIEIKNGSVTTTQLSTDAAVSKVVAALTDGYTAGELLPWRSMADKAYCAVEINTPFPAGVDFDLNPDANLWEAAGTKYYRMRTSPDHAKDAYISVITLGEASSGVNRLGISALSSTTSGGTTIDSPATIANKFVGSPFTAGGFLRNIKSITTQKIESASLIDTKSVKNEVKYQQKMEINFNNVFLKMNPRNENSNKRLLIGNDESFVIENLGITVSQVAYLQSRILNLLNEGKYNPTQLNDVANLTFPFITFSSPDVSPGNLKITTKWTTITTE